MKKTRKVQYDPRSLLQLVEKSVLSTDGIITPQDFSDFGFAAQGRKKPIIVIAAAPRSGSTFLANTLATLTGLPYRRLALGYSTNEHDIYPPALGIFNNVGCVSQVHMKGTLHNGAYLRVFGAKPVVLLRNIYDSVVSLRDDVRRKEEMPYFNLGANGYSFIWLDKEIVHYDDDRLLDAIIDLAVPWYVNFYVSWDRLEREGLVEPKWVTYEALMQDKAGTIKEILDFVGVGAAAAASEELFARTYQTFHLGGSGRGEQTLGAAQKQRIQRLLSYYPHVDFGRFGV